MQISAKVTGFNTQPPEGGWPMPLPQCGGISGFNTQPPEGGWPYSALVGFDLVEFQHTAARRRLVRVRLRARILSGFNTQPPEGGWHRVGRLVVDVVVSTHSRPKAAGT